MSYYCEKCFAGRALRCDGACPKCGGTCGILVPHATDAELDAAKSAIRRDYRADVIGIALDLAAQVKAREIESSEALSDAIYESVDGSQRVIYTYQAKLGLLASDNEDAWEQEGYGDNPTAEQRMYAALYADVREELERWGVDPDAHEDSDESEGK